MAVSVGKFPNRRKGHFGQQRCGSTEECCESSRHNMTKKRKSFNLWVT